MLTDALRCCAAHRKFIGRMNIALVRVWAILSVDSSAAEYVAASFLIPQWLSNLARIIIPTSASCIGHPRLGYCWDASK